MKAIARSREVSRDRRRLRADLRATLAVWRRMAPIVYVALLAILFPAVFGGGYPDAHAYYRAAADPSAMYANPMVGGLDAYLYSPVFAQVLAPLAALGWPVFAVGWYAVLGAVLWWLAREWSPLVLIVPVAYPWSPAGVVLPVLREVQVGNIQFLYAACVVAAATRPAVWVFPLLTKPTLGAGLVWYAARREWRRLAIAFAATALVVLASAALSPGLWTQWAALLLANAGGATLTPIEAPLAFLPLVPRLATSVVLVVWGARTNRRWTLVVGSLLALPVLWQTAPVLLLGLLSLARQRTLAGREDRALEASRTDLPGVGSSPSAASTLASTGIRRSSPPAGLAGGDDLA